MRALVAANVVVAVSFLACAPAAPRPTTAAPKPALPTDAGTDRPVAVGQDVPSLDELAARGPNVAPMMRETIRVSEAATTPIELDAKNGDACYRALVAASSPVRVRAWFEDDKRVRRGEVASAAGLVPPRGPACARKGEKLRLLVEADPGTVARAVVWQAP